MSITASTASIAAPAAKRAVSSVPSPMLVSPVESVSAPRAESRSTISRYGRVCARCKSSSSASLGVSRTSDSSSPAFLNPSDSAKYRSGDSGFPGPGSCPR